MEIYIFVFFAVAVAIAIFGYVYSQKLEKKRTEAVWKIAMDMGFQFRGQESEFYISNFPKSGIFGHGHSKKPFNVLEGTAKGTSIAIFDYSYTTGSGKHQH